MNPLFKIGSVYRNQRGDVVKLDSTGSDGQTGIDLSESAYANRVEGVDSDGAPKLVGVGLCLLGDGRNYVSGPGQDLIPGELHLVNGSWEPVEDKKEDDAPDSYFGGLDRFIYTRAKPFSQTTGKPFAPVNMKKYISSTVFTRPADPNAAMIARDGVAPKATTVALPTPPLTTAHKAVKGLSFLAAVDHRFGLGVR